MLRHRLGPGAVAALTASLSLTLVAQAPLPLRPVHPESTFNWMVGGTVHAVERVGNTIFIGGRFRALAPRTNLTGGFAVLSPASSRRAALTPPVNGTVHAVVFDPASASFFVAGHFSRVGPHPHSHIVRIHVNGEVDPAWSGRVTGLVRALALAPRPGGGRRLYVGGAFTSAAYGPTVVPARNLAAFDLPPGAPPAIVTGFTPDPDGAVDALAAVAMPATGGVQLYVGGEFGAIGGASRAHLARVHGDTGIADAWDPSADGRVLAVEAADDGGIVYAGGEFTSIGGAARSGAGAIATDDGSATAWNPAPDAPVRALIVRGAHVYAGGAFTVIGGLARQHLARLDATSGAATPGFDAPADDVVNAIAMGTAAGPPRLFVGGDFTNIGGRLRLHLASLDPITGSVTDWHPALNDTVRAIATGEFARAAGPVTLVAVGGDFDAVGAVARRNLAAVNLETGAVLPWRPAPDGVVRALHARGGVLYAGGDFTRIGQQSRNHLAAFSLVSRQLASWNPDADGPVHALASLATPAAGDGSPAVPDTDITVYAGGDFGAVGGQVRARIAAVSAATGAPTPWAPAGGDGPVLAIVPTPAFVYAGGRFTTLGAIAAPHLARLDTLTGIGDPGWSPTPDGEVRALALGGGAIFAGGRFDTLGGSTRHNIGAVDSVTGAATGWQPQTDGAVNALALEATTLYAGGTFANVGIRPRPRLVGLDITATGPDADYVTSFAPRWIGQVLDLDARGDGLVAAGDPLPAGNEDEPVSRVAFFPRLLNAPPARPAAVAASVQDRLVTLHWTPPALGARPTHYLLEAGVTPGGTEISGGASLLGASRAFANVPPGTYYLRLRAANPHGISDATDDTVVAVGAPACEGSLDAPSDLLAESAGNQVTLSWTPSPGGAGEAYRIEAGSTPGATAAQIVVSGSDTRFTTALPPGAWFVRVRAIGPCGTSAASNEVAVVGPGASAPPPAPGGLAATVDASTVTVNWDAVAGVTGYVLEVGSAPDTSDVASIALASTSFTAAGVPGGTYFLRVRAHHHAGASAASDQVVLVVP